MFLMNQWYAAGLPSELTDKPLARSICGEAIVMYRGAAGKSGCAIILLDADKLPMIEHARR